jgi:protein gp37
MATGIEWTDETWNPIAVRVGKKAASNHLDGVQHMEFPQ